MTFREKFMWVVLRKSVVFILFLKKGWNNDGHDIIIIIAIGASPCDAHGSIVLQI